MLTLQRRAMAADGVVTRTVHATAPPHVDYDLSDYGWTLGPILDALERWGPEHAAARRSQGEKAPEEAAAWRS